MGGRRWTYKDYLKLDDEHRYEIINGELYMAPAPGVGHQRVSRDLQYLFTRFIIKHKLGEVLNAPVDVILSASVVVQPDLVFIQKERSGICQERGVFGAPDLIVEIISPSSITRDRHSKLKLYRKHGVKEYWLVDPANRSVEVLELNGEGEYDLRSSAVGRGRVKSAVLEGFSVNIGSIFSGQ
ncbi:MAG: Uma2 family endonuclease [Armatimonadetes bacterium]|nr:Uma2 family endonuclease [Armatimonadota bacterium]